MKLRCSRMIWLGLGLLLAGLGSTAVAQFVGGEWVQRGEASIRRYRMTGVEFLVLRPDGTIASNAQVHLRQTEHAFGLGFILPDGPPPTIDRGQELWRAFNLVSIEPITGWRKLQPHRDQPPDLTAIDDAMAWASSSGLRVRWGPLTSAEAFALPEWAVGLPSRELLDASLDHGRLIANRYGDQLWDLDLCTGLLDHDRFQGAMLRILDAHLDAIAPALPTRLRYGSAWTGPRAFDVINALDLSVAEQLPTDGFALETRFAPGEIVQSQIEPDLRRLTRFGEPIVLSDLEVGGRNSIEAVVNIETVLRTAFAEPAVAGIVFSGLTAEDFADASASLIDETGQPTGVGRLVDRLFRQTWWSDVTTATDELGVARARVFLGEYEVTATLPGGASVSVPLRLDYRSEPPRRVILMPMKLANSVAPAEPIEPGQ